MMLPVGVPRLGASLSFGAEHDSTPTASRHADHPEPTLHCARKPRAMGSVAEFAQEAEFGQEE